TGCGQQKRGVRAVRTPRQGSNCVFASSGFGALVKEPLQGGAANANLPVGQLQALGRLVELAPPVEGGARERAAVVVAQFGADFGDGEQFIARHGESSVYWREVAVVLRSCGK